MIEIRHVNMVYPNGVRALNDINLTIDRNEFVFVVGASGAGKSTLIRLLGLEFPQEKYRSCFSGFPSA